MEHSKVPADNPPTTREQWQPREAANFPGSLVVDQLEDVPWVAAVPQHKGKVAAWAVHFQEGWGDTGIWKSTVGRFT